MGEGSRWKVEDGRSGLGEDEGEGARAWNRGQDGDAEQADEVWLKR